MGIQLNRKSTGVKGVFHKITLVGEDNFPYKMPRYKIEFDSYYYKKTTGLKVSFSPREKKYRNMI